MAEEYSPPPNGFRTFLIVWITQSVSVFGSALTYFAMNIWLVQVLYPLPEQKPQLSIALSAVALSFSIPTLALAPIAGAWADRHDRKRTMMVMDFVNGLLSIALVYLIASSLLALWSLVLIIVLSSIAGSFHASAFDTSYAMLVPRKQLPRANGMMQMIWSLSGIISPAIAAALISLPTIARQGVLGSRLAALLSPLRDGSPLAIGLDALTFFAASATLIFLFVPSPRRNDLPAAGGERKSIWADVKEGAVYIWRRRPMLWLLGTFTMANFASGPIGVFIPLVTRFNLAADWTTRGFTYETALAALSSLEAVGGVIGGLMISAWGGLKKQRVYGVLGGILLMASAQVLIGLTNWFYVACAGILLFELALPIMNSHSQTIWQTQVPVELQGRVFSVRRVIAQFAWPLSTALAGWVSGRYNPGTVMSALGILLAVFCAVQFFNPTLLRVEDKAWLDQLAESRATAEANEPTI